MSRLLWTRGCLIRETVKRLLKEVIKIKASFDKDDYLCHHGIKGQKWGVRRYQNEDGSLTPLGYKRYGYKSNGPNNIDSNKNEYDHSESRSSLNKAIVFSTLIRDIVRLRPLGLARDTKRLIDVVNANKKENAFNKRVESLKIDPQTGFHKKSSYMSEKDDMEMVNPGFKNFDENTKNNCMLCTLTYEMRRRGYDVTANKASYGYNFTNVNRWFNADIDTSFMIDRKSDTFRQDVLDANKKARHGKNIELAENVINKLIKQGDGARGNLMVTWGIRQGGHSVVYEIKNGEMIIRDCQANKIYNQNAAKKLLKHCMQASFARLDNAEFNNATIKEVCR